MVQRPTDKTVRFGLAPIRSSPATPSSADGSRQWRDRATRLLAAGDRMGAAAAFLRYMTAPIGDPALAQIVKDLSHGRAKAAEARTRDFLKVHPDDPLALRLLGQAGLLLESSAPAEAVFRRALALVPGHAPLRFDLATALFRQGKAEETLAELAPLLRQDTRHRGYRQLQAAALARTGAFAQALDIYSALLDEQPADVRTRILRGNILKTLRRGDEALADFRHAVALMPECGEAWWNIANLKTGALGEEDLAAIRAALASPRVGPSDRYHLHFALARALEEAGDFAAAMTAYRAANGARLAAMPERSGPPPSESVRRAAALFTPAFLASRAGQGDPSADPIFILGMPRSGSTLLEQILSCHPAIEGTQELADIPVMALRIRRAAGGPMPDGYPEKLAEMPPEALRALGAEYLERARAKRKTDRPHFLDKQPANWYHIGFIHLILPHARILDMRRDPLECCLSMFRQHFARGATFSYAIDTLVAEYRAYEAMTAHFDAVLPGRVKRVALADLQTDLEGTVRAVLDHLGLPFAEECLRFHESDRPVFTPSSEQVRQPINAAGRDLLRKFEPYIGDLAEALGQGAR